MIRSFPTGTSGKLIAVLLLLLLLTAAWRLAAAPLIGLYAQHGEEIDDKTLLLARLERLAAQLPALRESSRVRAGPQVTTLAGASDAIAAANLQTILQDLAGDAGVAVASVEILPAESMGPVRRVGVRLNLSGTNASIVHFIDAAGQASPPLAVNDLELHSKPFQGAGSGAQLNAALSLYGVRSLEPSGHAP
jgi:hypothetical protein